jgi:aryl-alcohol dehydrogenase-like predicted oxidoreductase
MDKDKKKTDMEYRLLGSAGIKVSVISFGNMINTTTEEGKKTNNDCVKKAWELGINYFDTA